jgi:hypothetical protein
MSGVSDGALMWLRSIACTVQAFEFLYRQKVVYQQRAFYFEFELRDIRTHACELHLSYGEPCAIAYDGKHLFRAFQIKTRRPALRCDTNHDDCELEDAFNADLDGTEYARLLGSFDFQGRR